MKKKEVKNMQDRLDQLENATAKVKNKLDKMSLHFVIPLVSFYFIVGLLLILLNETVTHVAAWALAAGLILAGGWLLIRYLVMYHELKTGNPGIAKIVGTDRQLRRTKMRNQPDIEYTFYAPVVEYETPNQKMHITYPIYTPQKWFEALTTQLATMEVLEAQGLAAYVYTQLTDIEEETNGLLTYDRRINKVHEALGTRENVQQ